MCVASDVIQTRGMEFLYGIESEMRRYVEEQEWPLGPKSSRIETANGQAQRETWLIPRVRWTQASSIESRTADMYDSSLLYLSKKRFAVGKNTCKDMQKN